MIDDDLAPSSRLVFCCFKSIEIGSPFLITKTCNVVKKAKLKVYLHQGFCWLARQIKHKISSWVNVGEASSIWNSKLNWVRFLAFWRNVSSSWQPLVANEIIWNWVYEKYFFLNLLLRVQAEIDENLRVVIGHCLLLCRQTRCIEAIQLDFGGGLEPT